MGKSLNLGHFLGGRGGCFRTYLFLCDFGLVEVKSVCWNFLGVFVFCDFEGFLKFYLNRSAD